MIRTFQHMGLEQFFVQGSYAGIPGRLGPRIERILDRLDAAVITDDMCLPGYCYRSVQSDSGDMYLTSVSNRWRITFRFDGGDAVSVDLEEVHE